MQGVKKMRLHDITPPPGSKDSSRRKGRGMSSRKGCTSGRGRDGQRSRSGGNLSPGFEGGQLPLIQRLPKRGFTNVFKKEWAIVNVDNLNVFEDGATVGPEDLQEKGLVKNLKNDIKILGNGELEKKLTVQAHKFSKSAESKIQEAGGKVEIL